MSLKVAIKPHPMKWKSKDKHNILVIKQTRAKGDNDQPSFNVHISQFQQLSIVSLLYYKELKLSADDFPHAEDILFVIIYFGV